MEYPYVNDGVTLVWENNSLHYSIPNVIVGMVTYSLIVTVGIFLMMRLLQKYKHEINFLSFQ